ncbi:unnamed protein product [Sphenostylis stenocarpa]|uniref:SCP domain-containing protein n=1 Tax=Sphenostylis stenocarpa TaxID=92480 RepID=A0AA86SCC4_9FABA|nr:unnamed protein product [Sphenostylis stenocarpa]
MKSSSLAFILTIVSTCSIFLAARSSPEDFLEVHNEARAAVGVKPLKWNETLVAYAQKYADSKKQTCEMEHSMGPYGENLAEGYEELKGSDAAKMWLSEKSFYDPETKQCVKDECLHYTQMVWNTTESIGCARTKCDNGWMFVICSYYPPGNYVGSAPY